MCVSWDSFLLCLGAKCFYLKSDTDFLPCFRGLMPELAAGTDTHTSADGGAGRAELSLHAPRLQSWALASSPWWSVTALSLITELGNRRAGWQGAADSQRESQQAGRSGISVCSGHNNLCIGVCHWKSPPAKWVLSPSHTVEENSSLRPVRASLALTPGLPLHGRPGDLSPQLPAQQCAPS